MDCGGPLPNKCKDGGGCATDSDCTSGICQNASCASVGVWSKGFADATSQMNGVVSLSVAADGANSVLVAGQYGGIVDFGGGPFKAMGVSDAFVAKFDASGKYPWAKHAGDVNVSDAAFTVVADVAGNVVLAGGFRSLFGFDASCSLDSQSTESIFVLRLNSLGNALWCKGFGSTGNHYAQSLALDSMGNVLVAGSMNGTVDFGGGLQTSSPTGDIFLLKLEPTMGNYVWADHFAGSKSRRDLRCCRWPGQRRHHGRVRLGPSASAAAR